ncbi:aminopeptidase P family protein [Aquihabitans sp. G128]|uniref:M24 family metallopeptidase n=1 Tax=Aquihabitans sp. G128 TaxID=2849779 RepID=UPI001C246AB8|nr:aminopeptidase P family protein [Aquihabitans sp. G128]QXC61871.1 aminopeptidase P family protein [Aquihabitans sp. G128]
MPDAPTTPDLTALAAMDVVGRATRLQAALEGAEVGALLVTNLTNVRYLTGFTGSAALLLVSAAGLTFVTDGRYGQQAEAQLAAAGVTATIEVSGTGQKALVTGAVAAAGIRALGLEADAVTWAAQRTYDEHWFPELDLVPTTGLVGGLRLHKDDGEVERIAAACAIADVALGQVRHRLAEAPTEVEFGLELDTAMRRLGADDVSFETIVASGPNGAKPHHRPGHRSIAEGDLVVIDFGALVDGYHSDMTRTVMVGEPSPTQARMYDVVAEAQAAGVAAVADGVPAKAVDDACRAVIDGAGWLDAFLHGTGHGVGLDIHEDPRVGQTSTATLSSRCVVTVEPGVYLPEHGGVRIEDTVVVTPDGCRPVTLTHKAPAV